MTKRLLKTSNPFAAWCERLGLPADAVYRLWIEKYGWDDAPTVNTIRNWFAGMIPSQQYFNRLAKLMNVDPLELDDEWRFWRAGQEAK